MLLEPTDLTIQAGCLGNLSARVIFRGVSGHSARPWLAENAIHAAVEGLARIATLERREAVIEGLPFYEVASVTRIEAGVADNVIPDTAVATVNLRYPPDRTPAEAEELAPLARPERRRRRGHRELAAGRRRGGRAPVRVPSRQSGDFPIEPKQAWTNVADFTARGIPADQLRAGRDAVRPSPRRAGRDRRARAGVRRAARRRARREHLSSNVTACRSPPRSARRRPTPSSGSTRRRPRAGHRGSR